MITYINQGGPILKILIAINILGWSLMLWKAISVYLFRRRIDIEKKQFKSYLENYQKSALSLSTEQQLDIALSHYMDPFYKGMDTIKVIATISPLLGLLGTVWGILNSFSVIAQKGLENPSLFAEGISMALVTTVGGLIVAIPHFIGHNYLKAYLVSLEKALEKKIIY